MSAGRIFAFELDPIAEAPVLYDAFDQIPEAGALAAAAFNMDRFFLLVEADKAPAFLELLEGMINGQAFAGFELTGYEREDLGRLLPRLREAFR